MWDFIWRLETLWALLMFLYVPCCIGLIIVVLLQKGKGSGFAGAFGIGAGADTVFGPRGSRSLPARLTQIMAAVFMIMALVMSMMSGRVGKGIAPEKVDVTKTSKELGQGGYDSLLDDLGSAIEEKGVATPATKTDASGPTTAPGTPESAPAEGTAQPASPAAVPGEVTVTIPADATPAEGAAATPAAGSPSGAEALRAPSEAAGATPEAAPSPGAEPAHSEGQPASPAGGS